MEPLGPYQVLLVESDSAIAEATKNTLSTWGLTVSVAKSGTDAVELTKAIAYDLILIEIKLPDIDGNETARIIRLLGDQFKNIPIIGYGLSTSEKSGENNFNDVLITPFDLTVFYETLKNHLDKGTPEVVMANLDRCTDGDAEFRRELAQLLANNMSELLLNIEKALKLNDPNIFVRAVHKTKTTLSILGDGELTAELTILQKKIGQDTSGDLEHHVQKLSNRCKKTINILNTLSTQP